MQDQYSFYQTETGQAPKPVVRTPRPTEQRITVTPAKPYRPSEAKVLGCGENRELATTTLIHARDVSLVRYQDVYTLSVRFSGRILSYCTQSISVALKWLDDDLNLCSEWRD